MKFNVDWYGDRIIAETEAELEQAVGEVTKDIEAGAKAICPVDSGRLRSSIKTTGYTEEGVAIGYVTAGDDEAYYASFVELGTSDMVGTPFLRTAIRSNKQRGQQKLVNAVKKVLNK